MINDILWLIPARSGSKSIIDKNVRILNNIPLINYRIKSALSISKKENIWVSTDSEEYSEIAKKAGATVPFLRPKNLASDSSSSIDVVLHAMELAKIRGLNFSMIGLLEPTSPFVYYNDLINAYSKLKNNENAESIVAVKETRPNTFFIQEENEFLDTISQRMEKIKYLGRQFFKKEITPSGGFYISKWNNFLNNKTFYTKRTLSFTLPEESSLEIDEPMDWNWAEYLIKNNIVDIKKLWS
jgi:CMP-N,N'-diacetyllegionaminic acid synthase